MSDALWKSITAVVVDPFGSEHLAIDKAAELARRSGAPLTLLNVFMIPQPTPEAVLGSRTQIIKSATAQRMKRLRQLASGVARRGLKVNCIVEWDYPVHEAIVRHVVKEGASLVVAESHRHSKIARWLLANTDWELIRACPCPVWFARSAELPTIPRVLVAVDPFHAHDKPARLDDRLVKIAQAVTRQVGGTVSLAHAFQSPEETHGRLERKATPKSTAVRLRQTADIEKHITDVALRHGIDSENCVVREGNPVQVLGALTAKGRSDVLIMGAVSRSFRDRPPIGNTAERVIDHVGCDVLIIKPAGFKTRVSRARRSPEVG
jgi:universal stress protein E